MNRSSLSVTSIRARIAHGAGWALFGAVVSRLILLVSNIGVARLLGRERFGEFGVVQTTATMLSTLAIFGIGVTATKRVAELRQHDRDRAGQVLGATEIIGVISSSLFSAALVLAAPLLAARALAAPQLAPALQVAAGVVFFGVIGGVSLGGLAGLERFRSIALANVVPAAIAVPVMLLGAKLAGVEGAVFGLVTASAFTLVAARLGLARETRLADITITFRRWRREMSSFWQLTLPAVLAGAMVGPVNWVCSALLVNQRSGYAEMGLYSAANQWFMAAIFIPSVVGQVLLPILSERLAARDGNGVQRVVIRMTGLYALLTVPLLTCVFFRRELMTLFGKGFIAGTGTFTVSVITAACVAVQAPAGQLIIAAGRLWSGFAMNLAWAAIFFFASLGLVHRGAIGLAGARLIAYSAHTLWTWGYAYWLVRRVGSRTTATEVERWQVPNG